MQRKDRLIGTARLMVGCAFVANRAFLLGVVALLILSWVFSARFAVLLQQSGDTIDLPSTMTGMRLLMLIGIVMGLATNQLLSALRRMIASAKAGNPFDAANAGRLQSIGWSLLVLQLLDIPCAFLDRFFPGLGSAAPSDGISVGGWVAVLMVFVLSRVFAAGSVMRTELETVV